MNETGNPAAVAGTETSEWKATKMVVAIGGALQGLGAVIAAVAHAVQGLPVPPWISLVLSIAPILIGSAMQIVQVLGYTRSRTDIKIALSRPFVPATDTPSVLQR